MQESKTVPLAVQATPSATWPGRSRGGASRHASCWETGPAGAPIAF